MTFFIALSSFGRMKTITLSLLILFSLSFCSLIPGIDTMDGYTAKKKLLNAANSIDRISVGIVTGSAASSTIVNMINTIVLPAIISINANKYYDKASVQDCVSKINSITGLILGGATTLPLCDIKEASFIDIGPINLINGKEAEVNNTLAFLLLFGGGSDAGTATGTGTGTSTGTGTGTSTGTGTGTSTGTGTGTSSTPAACTTSGATDGTIQQLSFSVVDAEYDLVNNRIVLVDSANKFHYYNPSTNADSTLTLNFAPLNVTVSPDGTKAAVGHDANATLINLPGTTLAREVATAIKANDIAMNNVYIYISNSLSTWGPIKSVTFADGAVTNHSGTTVYPTHLTLNSAGNSLYLIDTASSPVDIRRMSTAVNPPTYSYDSIYHGDHSMCGPIWLAKDNSKTFNSCLTAFTVSATQGSDIQYAGKLDSTTFLRIQHLNTDSSQIFFIPTNLYFSNSTFSDGTKVSNEYVYRHGLSNLGFLSKKTLPCFTSAGRSYKTEGKFVFVNSSSTEYYVIVKPDANSGNVNDQIIKFPY